MPLACRPTLCTGDDAEAAAEAEGEEDDVEPTQAALEERRQQNIRALVSGAELNCRRAALMPRLLTVQQVSCGSNLRRGLRSGIHSGNEILFCRKSGATCLLWSAMPACMPCQPSHA